ncbi:hypothetical protein Glove_103g75 [Diversispora epigaea]|uniref:RlpA-like protein double-psi beta-barrel domain-containing protein n=1 Tax=Diversispora epigaea TaxID=1348612 RepID=A0A397J778_9GLOM|nr:hypothetical protein Glove_103g75 [Diversispora epigaea]
MISFQKSAVLFFALALAVIFMLETASAGVIYRTIVKREGNLDFPAQKINGVWKGTVGGETTFYDIGLGACGTYNTNSEFVCAMPFEMFDPSPNGNPNLNPNCGKEVIVSRKVGGVVKSVRVICVDRCAGCKFGDIDLSPAAFNIIATPAEGRVLTNVTYTGEPPRAP